MLHRPHKNALTETVALPQHSLLLVHHKDGTMYLDSQIECLHLAQLILFAGVSSDGGDSSLSFLLNIAVSLLSKVK